MLPHQKKYFETEAFTEETQLFITDHLSIISTWVVSFGLSGGIAWDVNIRDLPREKATKHVVGTQNEVLFCVPIYNPAAQQAGRRKSEDPMNKIQPRTPLVD